MGGEGRSDILNVMRDVLIFFLSVYGIIAVLVLFAAVAFAFAVIRGLRGLVRLLPSRKRVWGTVYNAETKRPIPFARVQLIDSNKRVLETHIADRDGRYGFLAAPASFTNAVVHVQMLVSAPGFAFPSRRTPSLDTLVYDKLYFGEALSVQSAELINFDIPLDPINPAASHADASVPRIAPGVWTARIADIGLWVGLIVVPLAVVMRPTFFTIGLAFVFVGTVSQRVWGVIERPFGIVKDIATGRPLPFALITLHDETGRRCAFAISDERGRYFLLAAPETRTMSIHTPAEVVPGRTATIALSKSRGWITREVSV